VLELKLGLSLLACRRPDEALRHLDSALAGTLIPDLRASGERYRALALRMRASGTNAP
jgi:hypothetical protein